MTSFFSNFKKGREDARVEIAAYRGPLHKPAEDIQPAAGQPSHIKSEASAEDVAHIRLTAVYFVMAGILVVDFQLLHAICAVAAGIIYASLYRHSRNHLKSLSHQSVR